MKLKVEQKELVCNLKYIRACDYVHSYTDWINHGVAMKPFKDNSIFDKIKKDQRKSVSVYVKTGYDLIEFFNRIKDIDKKIVLITGSSDYSITKKVYKFKTDNVVKWYAENVEYEIDNLIPIPSGSLSATWIGNSKESSEIYNHRNFKLIKTDEKEPEIVNLAFMCFNIHTNATHRREVYNYFDNKSWVTNLSKTKTGKYLDDHIFAKNVYNHKFVISPYGNGVDCGRTWMTLQLGCIPVLPYNYCFKDWAKNLPIVLYDDINQVTEEYLLNKLTEIKNKNFNYEFLKISYWKNKFEEDKIYYSS
jgi:hypothetical protein|tara:strand:- start:2110 stop:3024 length:915 start_codon:yes stop_codon:yes gene_type:complete